MKKTDRLARELELSVIEAVEQARDWATPRVEAAVDWAVPRLQQGIDTASPRIQEGLKSAAHNLADGVATVTPRLQDGLAQLAPRINDVVEGTAPRLHDAVDKATPVILNARDRVVVEYLPKLSDGIGVASEAVHRTLESTPARVDLVAQKIADSAVVHGVKEQALAAGKVLTTQVQPEKPKKKPGYLVFAILAAAVTAGVAAWKVTRPVEDPWRTPSPVTPTPAPVAAGVSVEAETEAALGASASASADSGKHVAQDAGDDVAEVATDAKTAVQNIAANINNGEGSTSK